MVLLDAYQLGAFTTLTFDGVGNTTRRIDARSWATTYTVDALNRTTSQLYRDGTRVTNAFDAAGQTQSVGDVTGLTAYGYDGRGLPTSVGYPIGQRLTYTFDGSGNRLSLLDPDGRFTTYSWDAENRLSTLLNGFGETTTFLYDALGRESRRVLSNGIAISHTFDAAGRETVLENRKSDGTALSVYSASYDAVGNRTGVQELDGTRVTYGYDRSYQLVNEQRGGVNAYNVTYAYDSLGNRLAKTGGDAPMTAPMIPAHPLVGPSPSQTQYRDRATIAERLTSPTPSAINASISHVSHGIRLRLPRQTRSVDAPRVITGTCVAPSPRASSRSGIEDLAFAERPFCGFLFEQVRPFPTDSTGVSHHLADELRKDASSTAEKSAVYRSTSVIAESNSCQNSRSKRMADSSFQRPRASAH